MTAREKLTDKKVEKRESYRPGAPAMTCRVLQAGGGVARMKRDRLRRRCGFVVAASKAGDERDLLWTRSTRPGPGLRAGF